MKKRKFLYLISVGSLGLVTLNHYIDSEEEYLSSINEDQKKSVLNYNNKRIKNLRNNLSEEIKNDFKNNKTIFVGKRLYTFAEFGLKKI